MGWLFIHTERGAKRRFAPDLIDDPVVSFVDRTFLLWAVVGLAVPFALGYAIGGTLVAGLTALLWGGAVRVFLLHHFTYSINSVCHVFGRRRFATDDESRNVFWLALPTIWRGLAQQPPRLSHLGGPRARAAGSSIPPRR